VQVYEELMSIALRVMEHVDAANHL